MYDPARGIAEYYVSCTDVLLVDEMEGADSDSTAAGADIVYELFSLYATWTHGGRVCGVRFSQVKQLMQELDLLEGIPGDKVDAYVREHLLRADQDKDGQLSLQEFMVWFFTELAGTIPFKRNGAGYQEACPLYNRFVYYSLVDSGTGVRRKANGLNLTQMLRLCCDHDVTDDARLLRNGVQTALSAATADRVLGKMEGGSRLQFAAFVHAVTALAVKKMVGLDSIIFKMVGDGRPPPAVRPSPSPAPSAYRAHVLTTSMPLFFESELETPLKWNRYECSTCGREHGRWSIVDATIMQSYFRAVGLPFLPQFRHVNTRNARAVFHRYNLRCNKGLSPPSSTPPDDCHAEKWEDEAQPDSGCSSAAEQDEDFWATCYDSCCCMYKRMGLMEMHTWWKLCMDNAAVRECMNQQGSPLTPQRVEAAFMSACSIGGAYCKDTSTGIHDQPINGSSRSPLSAPSSSRPFTSLAPNTTSYGPRYGTPFDAASTMAVSTRRVSSARGASSGGLANRPMSASTSLTSSPAASPSKPSGPARHRPATPTLNFLQFLEALRLLAEDMVGHPQVLVNVEVALWRVLYDMISTGCPLPANAGLAWGSPGSKTRKWSGSQTATSPYI